VRRAWWLIVVAMVAGTLALISSGTLDTSASPAARPRNGGGSSDTGRAAGAKMTVARTRLMNYFPATRPQQGMWSSWDPVAINHDMTRIAAIGANTVRLILFPGTFGFPVIDARYRAELHQAIAIAAAHRLKVVLSLFNDWGAYTDLTGSERWARSLLSPYRGNSEIAYVELQNEINPADSFAMAWARLMLPRVRADVDRPVSLSVTGWGSADRLAELIQRLGTSQPDIYDYHFYGPLRDAREIFAAVARMAGNRPAMIGESGYSTAAGNASQPGVVPTESAHEAFQSYFYYVVERAARRAGLPPAAPWILNDFPPARRLNSIEQHFGLYRLNGTAKPAVKVIRNAFLAAARRSTPR
jgi:hypothetical protein